MRKIKFYAYIVVENYNRPLLVDETPKIFWLKKVAKEVAKKEWADCIVKKVLISEVI